MSVPTSPREPVLLDPARHKKLRLVRSDDYSPSSDLHASFIAAAEFASAALDFVIMFVRDEIDGRVQVEPIVLLGVVPGENVYLDGTRWDARYVPAYIRRYPFGLTRLPNADEPVVTIDAGWSGFSETEGDPLFEADERPAPRLTEAIGFIQQFEAEAARTLQFCQRLHELALLRDMNATVKLVNGESIDLNGILAVDEDKLRQLPDATVLELHRNGMLGLVHAHMMSLANMRALVERKGRHMQRAATA